MDLRECESTGILFDKNTCNYCNTVNYSHYWLEDEDPPDFIVQLENGLFILEEHAIEINTGYGETYFDHHNNRHQYFCFRGSYYDRDGLEENDLVMVRNGDIIQQCYAVYCEDIGEYVHETDANYCDDDGLYYYYSAPVRGMELAGYHSSYISNKSNGAKFTIGFEVEKEDPETKRKGDRSEIKQYGWDVERDGSLSDDGFELVSAIYDIHSNAMFEDIDNLSYYINSSFSRSCGGHINVRCEGKTSKELLTDIFANYAPLLFAMFYGRIGNSYCQAKKVKDINDYDRYQAFNLTKPNDILEIRIFGAVRNVDNLKFRVNLIREMVLSKSTTSRIIYDLCTPKSNLSTLLRTVYKDEAKYIKLVERVVNYTALYGDNSNLPVFLERKISNLKGRKS
jgi:hypothetical protein